MAGNPSGPIIGRGYPDRNWTSRVYSTSCCMFCGVKTLPRVERRRDLELGRSITWKTESPEAQSPFAVVLEPPGADNTKSPARLKEPRSGQCHDLRPLLPAVHRQLRMLSAMNGQTLRPLLGETLNDLFRTHGHLPTAREQAPRGPVASIVWDTARLRGP